MNNLPGDTVFSRNLVIIFIISSFAFFIAAFQPFGLSPDYENYEIFFQDARDDFWGLADETRFEPAFVYLTGVLVKALNVDVFVYGVMVFISVALKSYFIHRMSLGYFALVALVFYLFKIFPLHELTQLRAALAAAFVIGACFFVWSGRPWHGLLMCVPAFLFHYSSLMVFPFLFVPRVEREKALVIPFCIFLLLFVIVQYVVVMLEGFVPVFQSYESLNYGGEVVNPWSIVMWPEFFMILAAMFFWRDLTDVMRRIVVLQLIGFAIFYAAIQFPVVAARGREMFSVLWVLFVGQGFASTLRVKISIIAFVIFSIIVSINLYLILDFFH